jgi:hypothetical protein
VRLAGDDDNVPAPGDRRAVLIAGRELLQRREDDAAGVPAQLLAQIGAALGLLRLLPQQVDGPPELGKELVAEVVAVGEHDDRRVLERDVTEELADEENH